MSKNNKKVGPALRFKDKEGKAFPEWRVETLGAIAKFSKGKGISKADIDVDGDLECIRYGELYTEYNETISNVHSRTNLPASELVLSKKNDVIIPASGETQLDIATAACVLKDGVALGGDLNIIRTPENGVFLSYYLNSAKKHEIAALSQGISVVHLYAAQLSTVLIRLPVKEEQKKIASILTAIDNKIENLEQQLEALKAFKKGVMQGLFNFEEEHITPPQSCNAKDSV